MIKKERLYTDVRCEKIPPPRDKIIPFFFFFFLKSKEAGWERVGRLQEIEFTISPPKCSLLLDKSCQYVIDRRVNSSGFSMEPLRCDVTSTFVNDVTPPFHLSILCIRNLGGRGESFQRDYFSTFIV